MVGTCPQFLIKNQDLLTLKPFSCYYHYHHRHHYHLLLFTLIKWSLTFGGPLKVSCLISFFLICVTNTCMESFAPLFSMRLIKWHRLSCDPNIGTFSWPYATHLLCLLHQMWHHVTCMSPDVTPCHRYVTGCDTIPPIYHRMWHHVTGMSLDVTPCHRYVTRCDTMY